jgi:hypothetical protein
VVWKREHADETGTQRMNGRKGGREGGENSVGGFTQV